MEGFLSVENEFFTLLEDVCRIWQLVILQLEKAKQSLLCHDLNLAREIITREKRIDAYALKKVFLRFFIHFLIFQEVFFDTPTIPDFLQEIL